MSEEESSEEEDALAREHQGDEDDTNAIQQVKTPFIGLAIICVPHVQFLFYTRVTPACFALSIVPVF